MIRNITDPVDGKIKECMPACFNQVFSYLIISYSNDCFSLLITRNLDDFSYASVVSMDEKIVDFSLDYLDIQYIIGNKKKTVWRH